ncbi:aspartokinase [Purpureocillium lavendulum]|uniref:Aspartokinase n=1 Tax=Purpureocillium lavendulum TaxID=1247861 RepID=A0AB34FG63_9HYPO|nr:aspartokinase [Purpureocillium lavendulum]
MLWLVILFLSALPGGHAVESGGLVFCGETKPDAPICLQRVPDSCYECLHPIETSCGDPGQNPSGYAGCFCAIPGKSWKAITNCLSDASTGCADSQKYILNVYGVECATSSRKDAFEQEVCGAQQTDPFAKALAEVHCDGKV